MKRHKREKFKLSHSKRVAKIATQIATLKADDETKEEEYSHLKL